MPKTHVFRYSQLIETNQGIAVNNFAVASKLSINEILEITLVNANSIISEYKCGSIDSDSFYQKMNLELKKKGGQELEKEVFFNCWNSMCKIDSDNLEKLYEIQKQNICQLHVIGETNISQHEYIQNEITKLVDKPNISYTLSFEENTISQLELKTLAEIKIQTIYDNVTPESIIFHTTDSHSAIEILGEYYNSNE